MQVDLQTGIKEVTEPGVELIAHEVTKTGGWITKPAILMIPGIKNALGDMHEFVELNKSEQEAKVQEYINSEQRKGFSITLIERRRT